MKEKDSRILTIAAYGLSIFAAFLHFQSALLYGIAPSNLALQILTFGSIALIVGLLIFNFRQKLENKTVWIAALLIFAVSALHLSAKTEESSWYRRTHRASIFFAARFGDTFSGLSFCLRRSFFETRFVIAFTGFNGIFALYFCCRTASLSAQNSRRK